MISLNQYIVYNKDLIRETLKIDNQKWGENKQLDDILENKTIENIMFERDKTYLVIFEGDINYTKLICEKAITNNANVIFLINDYYLASNTAIIRIANEYKAEQKCNNLIKLYNNVSKNKLEKSTMDADETIFIGDEFEFNHIKDNIKNKTTFIKI